MIARLRFRHRVIGAGTPQGADHARTARGIARLIGMKAADRKQRERVRQREQCRDRRALPVHTCQSLCGQQGGRGNHVKIQASLHPQLRSPVPVVKSSVGRHVAPDAGGLICGLTKGNICTFPVLLPSFPAISRHFPRLASRSRCLMRRNICNAPEIRLDIRQKSNLSRCFKLFSLLVFGRGGFIIKSIKLASECLPTGQMRRSAVEASLPRGVIRSTRLLGPVTNI